MSKKRDALRRGIRSLIDATSRELAELEGRPAGPATGRGAAVPPAVPPVIPSFVNGDARGNGEPPDERREGSDAAEARGAPAAPAAPVDLPAAEPPSPAEPLDVLRLFPNLDLPSADLAPGGPAAPPSAAESPPQDKSPESRPEWIVGPEGRPNLARGDNPAAKRRRDSRPAARRGARKGTKAARPARHPAHEAAVDGVNPEQAHARKGVCFAYFINHDCWRVPEAYCNTALQVCAIRDCPVYHLHRESLERRFAGKFKHLW